MHKYLKKFFLDCTDINEYYDNLVSKTKQFKYVGITNEWLIDNYYLIVENKKSIYENRKGISKKLNKCSSIYAVVKNIVEESEYNINYKSFIKDINAYQKKQNMYFSYKEISSIPEILLLIYVSKLNEICRESYKELCAKEEIERIVNNLPPTSDVGVFEVNNIDIIHDSNYIFEISNQLKKLGVGTNLLFRECGLWFFCPPFVF